MEMDSSDENDLGLFGDGFGGSSPGPLEESSPSENRDQTCNICRWDNGAVDSEILCVTL